MSSSSVVMITTKARAVLAFDEELAKVIREIETEKQRHNTAMEVLLTKEMALEQAISKLGAN